MASRAEPERTEQDRWPHALNGKLQAPSIRHCPTAWVSPMTRAPHGDGTRMSDPAVRRTRSGQLEAHLLAGDGFSLCGDQLDESEGWRRWGTSFHPDELVGEFGGGLCIVCLGLALSQTSARPALRLVSAPGDPSMSADEVRTNDTEQASSSGSGGPLEPLDYESQVDLLTGDVAHIIGSVIDTVILWGEQVDGDEHFSAGDAAVLRTLLTVRESLAGAEGWGSPE